MHPMMWPLLLGVGIPEARSQPDDRPDLPDRDAPDEEWKAYKARMDAWRMEQDQREEESLAARRGYRDQREYEREFCAALDGQSRSAVKQEAERKKSKAAEKRERIRQRNLKRAGGTP